MYKFYHENVFQPLRDYLILQILFIKFTISYLMGYPYKKYTTVCKSSSYMDVGDSLRFVDDLYLDPVLILILNARYSFLYFATPFSSLFSLNIRIILYSSKISISRSSIIKIPKVHFQSLLILLNVINIQFETTQALQGNIELVKCLEERGYPFYSILDLHI